MDVELKYLKYKQKYDYIKTFIGGSESLTEKLNEDDLNLIKAAILFGAQHLDDKLYNLVAAIQHKDGTILYGLASRSPMSSSEVHGEESVISQARIYDQDRNNFKSLVCVTISVKFKSPCGSCRELLKHHFPNLDIIVPDYNNPEDIDKLVKIKSKYLLPYPYESGDTAPESKLGEPIDIIKK
jgi:cytidine deaminase